MTDLLSFVLTLLIVGGFVVGVDGFFAAKSMKDGLQFRKEVYEFVDNISLLSRQSLSASPELEDEIGLTVARLEGMARAQKEMVTKWDHYSNRKWVPLWTFGHYAIDSIRIAKKHGVS